MLVHFDTLVRLILQFRSEPESEPQPNVNRPICIEYGHAMEEKVMDSQGVRTMAIST
jgi:hypothetical protein